MAFWFHTASGVRARMWATRCPSAGLLPALASAAASATCATTAVSSYTALRQGGKAQGFRPTYSCTMHCPAKQIAWTQLMIGCSNCSTDKGR